MQLEGWGYAPLLFVHKMSASHHQKIGSPKTNVKGAFERLLAAKHWSIRIKKKQPLT